MEGAGTRSFSTVCSIQDAQKDDAVTTANSSESSDAASVSRDDPEATTMSPVVAIKADDVSESNNDEAEVAVATRSGPYTSSENMQDAREDVNGFLDAHVSLSKDGTATDVDGSEATAAVSRKTDVPESIVSSQNVTASWPAEDAVATSAEVRAIAEDVYDNIADDATVFQWFADAKTPEQREKALKRKREHCKWTSPPTRQPPSTLNLGFPTDGIVFHDSLPAPLNDNVTESNVVSENEKIDPPVTDPRQPAQPFKLTFPKDRIVFHDQLPIPVNDSFGELNANYVDQKIDHHVPDLCSSAPASGNVNQAVAATASPSDTESRQPKKSAPVESAVKSTPAELGSALDGLSVVLTRILRDEEAVRVLVSRGHLNPLIQEVLKLESGEVYCTGGCGRVRRE
ncbi:hypothetical protein AAVH_05791 [Aphelenchoides avenae]|nr:hypothetical protein AAVH_05791 [Aphelenchus avenae]